MAVDSVSLEPKCTNHFEQSTLTSRTLRSSKKPNKEGTRPLKPCNLVKILSRSFRSKKRKISPLNTLLRMILASTADAHGAVNFNAFYCDLIYLCHRVLVVLKKFKSELVKVTKVTQNLLKVNKYRRSVILEFLSVANLIAFTSRDFMPDAEPHSPHELRYIEESIECSDKIFMPKKLSQVFGLVFK